MGLFIGHDLGLNGFKSVQQITQTKELNICPLLSEIRTKRLIKPETLC